ncbi:ATP-binding cassette domain-containing protein [Marinobacterium lutimaris]|uniref:Peptide/nickel transport system ATP-binding protein n=1 Tax=Marinobacterium lutimaris TaxID=568106 RepID=A0A1H5VEX6_9GAMM|nr:ATP-binding cassette domain-containing protein [Marinobacterium lutimaris]SEF85902.1 peptide/nickel transport system ATP-binding protein [Marinobacterium lutimaris]
MSLLTFENFSLGFQRYDSPLKRSIKPVLDDISLSIAPGEIVAMIGASGAGKSLLAHAVFGILPPNIALNGRISFAGEALSASSQERHRGRSISLVPQSISSLDPLARCGQQLKWAARRAGLKANAQTLGATLARYGLGKEVLRFYPHQLSGGMARRLMLAIATIGEPELVVADEPTSGLDAETATIVLQELRALADKGKAVLLITHNLAESLPFADQVAILSNGRLVSLEATSAFIENGDRLNSAYAQNLWRSLPQRDFNLNPALQIPEPILEPVQEPAYA